jgi:hypothetical protein
MVVALAFSIGRSEKLIHLFGANMRKQINTTLGELIAAVTDEVLPVAGSRANAHALVSYILTDLFATRRVRLRRRTAAANS